MARDDKHLGTMVISVDVPAQDTRPRREWQAASRQLMRILKERRIAATWSVTEPATSALSSQILSEPVPHEIALLGQSAWTDPRAGRTRFARELNRCVSAAHEAGIPISTLAVRTVEPTENLELLIKHHISVIRGRIDRPGISLSRPVPHCVRFGVWKAPVSRVLPRSHTWAASRWMWRRTILATCKQAGFVHLAVDLSAGSTSQSLGDFELAVEAAEQLEQERYIQIRTLRQLPEALAPQRTGTGQRSILRTA